MNSRNNNLLNTVYWRHADAPYDDDRIHVSSTSLVRGLTSGVVGRMGSFGSIQDRAYVLPFALARVTSQPPIQNLIRNMNMPIDTHPRPRFTTNQSTMSSDPILKLDEQNKGLEKLRREVYNPIVERVSLYYRDYSSRTKSRVNQNNEDGKRCAVCLDDFEPREMVTLTPCHHMFHENCIVPWVKSHGQCPVCRFVIKEREGSRSSSSNNSSSELGNDPFARELVSFIRPMEARG